MRLTPEVITAAPSYINPLKERELGLRGLKIEAIENLGVTKDEFQVIDFSDNDLAKLENFPLMKNLVTILANNNRISRIAEGLGAFLPQLNNLILTNNKIAQLETIDALTSLPRLYTLSLLGNPVTRLPNYRQYAIYKLPRLQVLDFAKIKPKEREAAKKLFAAAAADAKAPSTTSSSSSAPSSAPAPLTAEQRKQLEAAILNATSSEELAALEKQLAAGVVPS